MAKLADTYLIYQVLKRLTTPFDETKAFELGLIDKDGKLLKKAKTREEKEAYTYFDRFIFNLKRLLHRVGLKSKFASYGAALFLLREVNEDEYIPSDQEMLKGILENEKYLRENVDKTLDMIREDAPANATGAAVAGTGSDPVHWGKRPGLKGNRKKVGRSISALNFIKQRNKMMANTNVKSSYPAGAFKVEDYTHYPVQVDPEKDKTDGDWIIGDPPMPIKMTGDAENDLEKANKDIEKARGVKQKPFVESLWANIHKKRKEGRPMRKKGEKGAPTPAQMKRAQAASEEAPTIGGIKMKKLGKGKPGGYKSLVTRHLGAKAAEKIDKSDGSKLVAKGKKTGNTDLIRKGNFIKNVLGRK